MLVKKRHRPLVTIRTSVAHGAWRNIIQGLYHEAALMDRRIEMGRMRARIELKKAADTAARKAALSIGGVFLGYSLFRKRMFDPFGCGSSSI